MFLFSLFYPLIEIVPVKLLLPNFYLMNREAPEGQKKISELSIRNSSFYFHNTSIILHYGNKTVPSIPSSLIRYCNSYTKQSKSLGQPKALAQTDCSSFYLNLLSLSALSTTQTLDIDIAKAANIGLSCGPPKSVNTPVAKGIPRLL